MIAPEAVGALTGTQKASAGLGAVPTARTHHPYIVGIALVLIGGVGLIGSITGTLPSMIAALFVPSALENGPGDTPKPGRPKGVLAPVNPLTSSPTLGTPITVGSAQDIYNWTITDPSNWLNSL